MIWNNVFNKQVDNNNISTKTLIIMSFASKDVNDDDSLVVDSQVVQAKECL